MLDAKGLSRTVAGRAIVDGVSFQVPEGGIATVLGPSGSGKTTLLRLVMGLERLDAGALEIDGEALSAPGVFVPPEARGFAMVFQEFTLFPHLDVAANVAFGLTRGEDREAVLDELLALLEIEPLRQRRIDRLSGGEQQRVALARALAVRPRVLLLDEPFSNIDRMLRDRLYRRFKAYLNERRITALLATHDHEEAFFFSDRLLILNDGRLVAADTPRRVYAETADPWVARFLGPVNLLTGRELAGLAPGDWDGARRYLLRPEAFELVAPGAAEATVGATARVEAVDDFGFYRDIALRLGGGETLRVRVLSSDAPEPGAEVGVRLKPGVAPRPMADIGDGVGGAEAPA